MNVKLAGGSASKHQGSFILHQHFKKQTHPSFDDSFPHRLLVCSVLESIFRFSQIHWLPNKYLSCCVQHPPNVERSLAIFQYQQLIQNRAQNWLSREHQSDSFNRRNHLPYYHISNVDGSSTTDDDDAATGSFPPLFGVVMILQF
jgi:hypothetical protein